MGLLKLMVAGAASVLVAGCTMSAPGERSGTATRGQAANAELRDVAGQVRARGSATQSGDAIRVRLDATGMPSGTYAAHVHTTGACNPPDFTSAGPHWNPTGAQHGKDNPAGMHKGDLPNLIVGANGRGSLEFVIAAATLTGGPNALLDADGAALVVHAQADDYRSDPAGNAGARIACGVLR
jgi:Cu-Zn family superoxide dismutase